MRRFHPPVMSSLSFCILLSHRFPDSEFGPCLTGRSITAGHKSVPRRLKVLQPEVGNECGQDDGQGRGKTFQDIICIFNNSCYDQTSQSL